jgi:enoyl-CoA hydratase
MATTMALHTFENLQYEVKNQIAHITISRPKVLNALNTATLAELKSAIESARNDDEVRVVILTGSGEKAFVAGADINFVAATNAVTGRELALLAKGVFSTIENLGKPVIAAVNGFALGGGCELAMSCTIRIASENAKFGQPEIKLGVIPGFGGSQRLPRLVGKGLAMQMMLTGDMISAQEALRIGLVNEVTPLAELLPRAEAIAAKIVAASSLITAMCLEVVNKGTEMPLEEALDFEAAIFGICCATEDKNEGTSAFLNKRPAVFQGK